MRQPLRFLPLLAIALGVVLGVRAHDARAAWPPAPGADMKDPANWPNDYKGRWNYLSYFPNRDANAPPLEEADVKLGAAGMSIDKAWTYTIGRPDVRIAVIDSGIHWDNKDLVNKAALNLAELSKPEQRPKDKDGNACGGQGALAGYDCNGDGVFNVADYRDDPRIAPAVPGEKCHPEHDKSKTGPDRIKGDLNRNCILDPGDLILMFSDGVDDDANGYTDDICGWDFFKNDNDPYDDTRYGHGTGEAKDSTAEANNMEGDPGVCPGCRFVPLRVGDSFIGDANDFGKAVVYAADNGAKVVQEALGTINNTAFAKAAIDYAYAKGTIVVASMADENSRHHNMPATANHVLTVHTVRYDEEKPERSSTFIAFDTCSNYGGHLSLSISGTSCSSEATGRASGLAGLIYSMAAQEQLDPPLSAEEAIQIFKTYADDIDVPSSRGEGAVFFHSQPGWDQRFGYGRANAARMMQAIKDRAIPPEVDIVSPEWFTPVFADRSSAIAVMGRVSAARAQTYDFKVEVAAGVQPEDSAFREVAQPLTAVPGKTVTGGQMPLATIDPRQIDTTHVRDPDSKLGENDRTITIRVRAIAHYPGKDVVGEARRVISVTNEKNGLDRDLLPGFPVALGTSAEASPKLADIDGDGVRDLVLGDSSGKLHVYNLRGGVPVEVAGFPYLTRVIDGLNKDLSSEPTVPSYRAAPAYKAGKDGGIDPESVRETILQAPAVGDLDGDGKLDIVFATWPGTLYAINAKGQDLAGFPKRLPLVPSCPLDPSKTAAGPCMDLGHRVARGTHAAPVLVDMNKDGRPEIVLTAFDANVYVFKSDGTPLDGFPVALEMKGQVTTGPGRIMATPSVADLDGDGIPEIVSGSNQTIGGGEGAGPVFVVNGRGNATSGGPYLPHWPIVMTSVMAFPVVATGVVASQALGDFDGDGVPEILIQGNAARPLVLKADPGAQTGLNEPENRVPVVTKPNGEVQKGLDATSIFGEKSKAFTPDVMFPLFGEPSLGDMDQDGVLDVVTSGGSLTLLGALAGRGRRTENAQQLLAMWSGKTGSMFPGSPVLIEDFTFLNNIAIADVSGDDYPEAILGTGGYFVHAADACGREAPGFPKFTNGWIASTVAVGDLDGDAAKGLEIVASTRDGWLFAWHTQGRASGPVQWESFHHDNANTGNVATKLEQGSTQRPASPINCEAPPAPEDERLELGGGCMCRTQGQGRGEGAPWPVGLGLLGIGALAIRRKRARA